MDSLREKRRVNPWESIEPLNTVNLFNPPSRPVAGPLFREPYPIYEADSTGDQASSEGETARPRILSSRRVEHPNTPKQDESHSTRRVEHPKTPKRDESHSTSSVHAVFNGANSHNITVHLNIPVIDNLESDLEEFSILRRLGNFKAAKAYFNERLGEYRRVPYVFVQYAQMLLDAGDFRALSKLRPEVVFRPAGEYVRTPGMTGYDTSLSHDTEYLLRSC